MRSKGIAHLKRLSTAVAFHTLGNRRFSTVVTACKREQPQKRSLHMILHPPVRENARKPCVRDKTFPERAHERAKHPRPTFPAPHAATHPLHIHSLSHTRTGLPLWQFYQQTSAQSPGGHITRPTSHKSPPCSSPIRRHHAHTRMVAAMRQPQPLSGELSLTFPRAFLELVHQPAIQQLYSFQRRLSVARTHAPSRGDWRAVL